MSVSILPAGNLSPPSLGLVPLDLRKTVSPGGHRGIWSSLRSGFTPDVVVGHTGWGETLFVKNVWPTIPLLGSARRAKRPLQTGGFACEGDAFDRLISFEQFLLP